MAFLNFDLDNEYIKRTVSSGATYFYRITGNFYRLKLAEFEKTDIDFWQIGEIGKSATIIFFAGVSNPEIQIFSAIL